MEVVSVVSSKAVASSTGGRITRDKLIGRFDRFAAGQWDELLHVSHKCDEDAVTARTRRSRRAPKDEVRRAARALQFVQWGELSSGRQALEGAALVPGDRHTLNMLRGRPETTREPNPGVAKRRPRVPFGRANVRSQRSIRQKGSSCRNPHDLHALFVVAESFARGPDASKHCPNCEVGQNDGTKEERRAGSAGLLLARGLSGVGCKNNHSTIGPAVAVATAPYQYALTTRAGCECVSHALQALCDIDEDATITSIDGVSAYDTISRRAMLRKG